MQPEEQDTDQLAHALLGGLKDFFGKSLPGTADTADAGQAVEEDDDSGLLDKIKDILTSPLPGTASDDAPRKVEVDADRATDRRPPMRPADDSASGGERVATGAGRDDDSDERGGRGKSRGAEKARGEKGRGEKGRGEKGRGEKGRGEKGRGKGRGRDPEEERAHEGMKLRQEREREDLKRRHEREREDLQRRHELERDAR